MDARIKGDENAGKVLSSMPDRVEAQWKAAIMMKKKEEKKNKTICQCWKDEVTFLDH